MFSLLRKLFRGKTIAEQLEDFDQQYMLARFVSAHYLTLWFEKIFSANNFKEAFSDEPEIHKVLAVQVNNYLFAEEASSTQTSDFSKETIKQIEQVLPHVSKWADDAMTQDPDFRELVIQTLRMEAMIEQIKHGVSEFLETEKGSRVQKLLHAYGGQVTAAPDSKSYEHLLGKWSKWQQSVGNK